MADMERLRRLSRLMQNIVLVFTGVLFVAACWVILGSFSNKAGFEGVLRQSLSIDGPITLTSSSIGVTVVLMLVQLGLFVAALYCVWRMFGAFAAEEPLSGDSALWMRRAGLSFVVVAGGSIVLQTAVILVLTLGNPPGQKMLAVGVGSSELLALLIASIMYMTSRLITVAAEVRADQKGFI